MEHSKQTHKTQAEHIIEDIFGGITSMSKMLGHKYPTTVQGWKARGFIPAPQQPTVLAIGKENNLPITPDDFFWPQPKE